MGIGMVVIIDKDNVDILLEAAGGLNENIYKIGEIVTGRGEVIINGI